MVEKNSFNFIAIVSGGRSEKKSKQTVSMAGKD